MGIDFLAFCFPCIAHGFCLLPVGNRQIQTNQGGLILADLTVDNVENLQIYLSTHLLWLKLCIYKVIARLMSQFLHFKSVKKNLIQPQAIYVLKLFWDYIT